MNSSDVLLKKHIRNGVLTLAVCDSNLVGKTFEEGDLYLDLNFNYYGGTLSFEEEITQVLSQAKSAIIVGLNSTNIVKKLYPDSIIKTIQDIPFMNIMKI